MFVAIMAVVLVAAHPDSESRLKFRRPPQTNLLLQFAGNKFDVWTISHRIDMPLGGKRPEVVSMPGQIGRSSRCSSTRRSSS